ncbi:MAG: hypothetical protein D6807_07395, partial [Alphaproteobacteria bacterium]
MRPVIARVLSLGILALGACEPAPPARDFDVVEATIAEIQAAIEDGRITCVGVVDAYLARITAYDKPSGLNAITVVNP